MIKWLSRFKGASQRREIRAHFTAQKAVKAHHIVNPWHAISIVGGLGPLCDAARERKEKRFLSAEAPPLPLAQCQFPHQCTCRYRHHADRRAGPRRSRDIGLASRDYLLAERRARTSGRRATDH